MPLMANRLFHWDKDNNHSMKTHPFFQNRNLAIVTKHQKENNTDYIEFLQECKENYKNGDYNYFTNDELLDYITNSYSIFKEIEIGNWSDGLYIYKIEAKVML